MKYSIACQNCGREFETAHGKTLYCSAKCQYEAKKETRNAKDYTPLVLRQYECRECGIIFNPNTGSQKFCTPECAQKYVEKEVKKAGRFVIFERDNFTCFYCGRTSYKNWAILHCDHLIPKSNGGEDICSNLVTACERCNLEKHTIAIMDLKKLQKEVKSRNKLRKLPDKMKIKLTPSKSIPNLS